MTKATLRIKHSAGQLDIDDARAELIRDMTPGHYELQLETPLYQIALELTREDLEELLTPLFDDITPM